jgi:putative methyltransferase, YaeB/AF_0241 family
MFQLNPIGILHTPHQRAQGTPIQPRWAEGAQGTAVLDPSLAPGLKDLEGIERIWLIYWFDRAGPANLEVVPFLDRQSYGVFATRAPARPNPIGLSNVKLLGIEANVLKLSGVDMLDGTPLLDIKPYLPDFDAFEVTSLGWYAAARGSGKADGRFEKKP